MRIWIFILSFFVLDSHAEDQKKADSSNFVSRFFHKGVSKVESRVEKFKESSSGQYLKKTKSSIGDFFQNSSDNVSEKILDMFIENREEIVSDDYQNAKKDFVAQVESLQEDLQSFIRNFKEISELEYKDRIVLYENGLKATDSLKEMLSQPVTIILEARKLEEKVLGEMATVTNILKDELIESSVEDLKKSYENFQKALRDTEEQARKKYKK